MFDENPIKLKIYVAVEFIVTLIFTYKYMCFFQMITFFLFPMETTEKLMSDGF